MLLPIIAEPTRNGQASSGPAAVEEAALDYADRGWPVHRCRPGTKVPIEKVWQHNATTDAATIRGWWARRPNCNVGVLLGERSGIIDVECDSDEGERQLAALLGEDSPVVPTFCSKRGKHRLFLWSPDLPNPDSAFFTVRGVEFRTGNGGKGAQSLFPPSIHPGGAVYRWLVHPDEADPAPLPAAALARIRAGCRIGPRATTVIQDSCNTADTADSAAPPPLLAPAVLQAIKRTLPTVPGQRNRRVFDLARQLKAIPSLADADLSTLRPIVCEWHRQALPCIRTQAFTETWADFATAWGRVRQAAGEGVVEAAFTRAAESKPPPKAVALYAAEPAVLLLAALCRELQGIAGDGPFFLDCRTAGRLVGVPYTTAWRLLTQVFPADAILSIGAKGSLEAGRANEYRYIAD